MEAIITLEGEPETKISVARQGKLSDTILKFKAEVSKHLTAHIEKHNLNKDEVNVMEEVISDDEGATAKSNKKSSKQHKVDKRKRGLQYPEG